MSTAGKPYFVTVEMLSTAITMNVNYVSQKKTKGQTHGEKLFQILQKSWIRWCSL